MIIKRTFAAERSPKGSPERARLSLDAATSEYMTSYKYVIQGPGFSIATRTKAEAEAKHRQYTPTVAG